ncbi:YaaR family protein [Halobacillus mangrovi]|uniref:DUF327 domain-containing protein n=1 Tax=Halobacillus mangrovi TaxID=402384 RepID=A0A1W5ZQA8_9BACI|nr:YaaR family protein [Halobacillus mangrovi]ARI75476.1 hypothetical protein HM131_00915 [Halobacillus mangrovi]
MKVSQEMRTQLDSAKKPSSKQPQGRSNFDTLVQSQTRQLQEAQLNQLMKKISSQGDRLVRTRSFKDLAKYKRLIKEFIKEAAQSGMSLKHSHSWNQNGQTRKLTIVETVDDQLKQLTEIVIEQERRSIDMLGMIGEIKGLLINLYT